MRLITKTLTPFLGVPSKTTPQPTLIQHLRHAAKWLRDWCWDTIHGVETRSVVELSSLHTVGHSRKEDCRPCVPSSPNLLPNILRKLGLDYSGFTLIDIGAGKGGPILGAMRFPFAKILGIEFGEELQRIANNNIQNFRFGRRKCGHVCCIHGDATEMKFPSGNLFLYLFNPFGEKVMTDFIQNLQASLVDEPRETYIVFAGHIRRDGPALAAFPAMEKILLHKHAVVYRITPIKADLAA